MGEIIIIIITHLQLLKAKAFCPCDAFLSFHFRQTLDSQPEGPRQPERVSIPGLGNRDGCSVFIASAIARDFLALPALRLIAPAGI